MMSGWMRPCLLALVLLGTAVSVSACGDTWRGFKQDTGENLEKTGETIEKTGEAVKP
jgi:predicted small secreted protein